MRPSTQSRLSPERYVLLDSEGRLVRVATGVEPIVEMIMTILNQFPEMNIVIEGHTDSIGTEEYNLGLSRQRAQAVHDFLVSQDVDASRLTWEGFGESRPVADNDSNESRQKNRRVDLVIQDAP